MKTLFAVSLALFLTSPFSPPEPPMAMHKTIHAPDGHAVRLTITPAEADRIPQWHPEQGKPAPISIKLAIDLARDSVKSQNPTLDTFEVQSIETSRIGGGYQDRWYYIVSFRPVVDGRPLRGTGYLALVMMDGTVKAPEVLSNQPSN